MKIGISIISEPYAIPSDDPIWFSSSKKNAAIHFNPSFLKGTGTVKKIGNSVAVQRAKFSVIACYVSSNADVDEFDEFIDELDSLIKVSHTNVILGGDFNY